MSDQPIPIPPEVPLPPPFDPDPPVGDPAEEDVIKGPKQDD